MNRRIILGLLVLTACSGSQGSRSDLPAAARPIWDQCRSAINTLCHSRAQGDPTLERECEATTGNEFGALPDDEARRRYMRARQCQL